MADWTTIDPDGVMDYVSDKSMSDWLNQIGLVDSSVMQEKEEPRDMIDRIAAIGAPVFLLSKVATSDWTVLYLSALLTSGVTLFYWWLLSQDLSDYDASEDHDCF